MNIRKKYEINSTQNCSKKVTTYILMAPKRASVCSVTFDRDGAYNVFDNCICWSMLSHSWNIPIGQHFLYARPCVDAGWISSMQLFRNRRTQTKFIDPIKCVDFWQGLQQLIYICHTGIHTYPFRFCLQIFQLLRNLCWFRWLFIPNSMPALIV